MPSDVYTFGDGAAAGHRLDLLAAVYEAPTRALLARVPPAPGHAVDLGCGPGHSTLLVHAATRAARTTGVERSPSYLAAARERAVPGVTFVGADVTGPLPVEPADLVFARFLLTHLADVPGALRTWAASLAPGGVLVLQESARLVSREPAVARYYELVAELQQRHDQALDVGTALAGHAAAAGLTVEHAAVRPLRPRTAEMAALHVLNLRTWRHDERAATFDADELDALDDALAAIARGAPSEPVEQDLAELVVRA